MRRFIWVIWLMLSVAPIFGTETLWASGVSIERGWYDFNKVRGRSEDKLCWAITAANMVAWWQNRQDTLPAGVPVGNEVWRVYRAAFDNNGGDPDWGILWWFTGDYTPHRRTDGRSHAAVRDSSLGGYYRQSGEEFFRSIHYRNRGVDLQAPQLVRALCDGFSRGDAFWIAVTYRRADGRLYSHSLNLWGGEVERTEQGEMKLTAVYLTDSDDGACVLHRIPLRIKEGRLLFDCPRHPIYGRIGDITICNYSALRALPL